MVTNALPQLNFNLNNPGAPDTIYISTDPQDNQLTLVMTSTVAASFSTATLVPPSLAAGASGSLLYLDLTSLGLSSAEFSALTLSAPGWASQTYSDSGNQLIGFAPTEPQQLATSGNITLALQGFAIAQQPGASASLTVMAYRVTGVTVGSFPITGNITVVFTLPDGNTGNLQDAIALSATPNEVVNSVNAYPDIANQLLLTLSPGGTPATVKAGTDTVFTLSFVYASDTNGYGALLTVAQGGAVAVTAAQGTTDWVITPHPNSDAPYWTLVPPDGAAILGSGSHLSIAFEIGDIITNFKPGPTVMLLGYSGIKGYKNGTYSLPIIKQSHVEISSFTVTPDPAVLKDDVAAMTLKWTSSHATRLTLQPLGVDVTGKTSYTATIPDTTQFTLVAEGQNPGNVDNVASASVTATVLPVINGFSASPGAIYVGDFGTGYPTTLAWNVNTNEQVTLTSSASGPVGPAYPPVSSATLSLSAPQMLTLSPQGGSNNPTVSRSLYVAGFTLAAATATTGHDSAFIAAPGNAGFVAASAAAENLVAILSTANGQTITTVPVGAAPQGIAFSADGTAMMVANSGDGTVSIFTVANVATQPAFSFTLAATLQIGGAPQFIVVGPNGNAYVTVDKGSSANGQVVVLSKTGTSYSAGATVPVGIAPRGIAISPSGGLLFVANQGSGSISQLVLGSGDPAGATLITGLSAPTGIAATPDGKRFLVACSGSGAVYGYSVQFPTTSPRQVFALAGALYVATLPGGGYAVATGTKPNQMALLNLTTGSVSATQALGAAPLGIGVTPEGGLAIAALPGSNTVAVITLAEYAQVAATTAAGGQVTSLAVSPDNQTLLAWYNAAISVSVGGAKKPLTGVIRAPANGASFTPYLAGTSINDIAISPKMADNAIYIALNGGGISVNALSNFAAIASIPIPALSGSSNRQAVSLGVSNDGATLFALVADGANKFSVLVIAADVAGKSFSVSADIMAYSTTVGPMSTPLVTGPVVGGVSAYALDTVGANLWTVSGSGTSWRVASSAIALAPGVPGAIATAIAISPDGSTAYVALQQMFNNFISVVDLVAATATLVHLTDSTNTVNISALQVSADGTKLFASDSASAAIRILDAVSLRTVQTLAWQQNVQAPFGIAAASDGSALFSANVGSQNVAIAQQVSPG